MVIYLINSSKELLIGLGLLVFSIPCILLGVQEFRKWKKLDDRRYYIDKAYYDNYEENRGQQVIVGSWVFRYFLFGITLIVCGLIIIIRSFDLF